MATHFFIDHPALHGSLKINLERPGQLMGDNLANYTRATDATDAKLANDLIDALVDQVSVPRKQAGGLADAGDWCTMGEVPSFDIEPILHA